MDGTERRDRTDKNMTYMQAFPIFALFKHGKSIRSVLGMIFATKKATPLHKQQNGGSTIDFENWSFSSDGYTLLR